MNRTSRSLPTAVRAALLGAAFPLAAHAAPGACFVNCVEEPCVIDRTNYPGNMPRKVESCEGVRLEAGQAVVSFRSRGKAGQVVAKGGDDFRTLLARYLPIDCLSFQRDESCPTAQRSTGLVLGKGFEGQDTWQPAGDPCGLGLPCGSVALGSAGAPWTAGLSDASAQGTLRLLATRGQAADLTVPVTAGRFTLPPGWLRTGETYRYRFADAAGRTLAAGAFATLSTAAQRDAEQFLAEARRAPVADRLNAVMRSLLDDGLDWDALQWSLGVRGRP